MISNIVAAISILAAGVLSFLLGKSSQKAMYNEEKAKSIKSEAQEWADIPLTPSDTSGKLRDRAANKR